MTNGITAIRSYRVDSERDCMGYPDPGGCDELAYWWFDTPLLIRAMLPDSLPRIYLCESCWSAFMAVVAVAIVVVEP